MGLHLQCGAGVTEQWWPEDQESPWQPPGVWNTSHEAGCGPKEENVNVRLGFGT